MKTYRKALLHALKVATATGLQSDDIVGASVFTTQSATALLEKIRDQLKAVPPLPADFLLEPGGTRTMFPLATIADITFNQQVGTEPTFSPSVVPVGALGIIPGVVDALAFGKYLSPDYETAGGFIPPVGTHFGVPLVQKINHVFFNLFLPAGPRPANGWPVAIFGHGLTAHKNVAPFLGAATLAASGIATIAINAVGHGNGPLSTLIVNKQDGSTVTFSAGGRSIDQDGDGDIGAVEGVIAAPPQTIIDFRDGIRQTVVDLMQLVRVIELGVDVDGDGVRELDPSRIYYVGQSFGGIYGTIFLAVEPSIRTGVLTVPGGSIIEVQRLSRPLRLLVGRSLGLRTPPLINVGGITGIEFNENIPLRNQPPVVNLVSGAIAIQQFIEHREWVGQSGDPVAYAPHLWKSPLSGVPAKSIILQFAKGDQTVPNPTTTAILRTGDLAGELRGTWRVPEALLIGALTAQASYLVKVRVFGRTPPLLSLPERQPPLLPPDRALSREFFSQFFSRLLEEPGPADGIITWHDADENGVLSLPDRLVVNLFHFGTDERVIDLSRATLFFPEE